MKRFEELNKDQQEEAIQYAMMILDQRIVDGTLYASRRLTERERRSYAEAAAEGAWYSSPYDMVVDGIVGEEPFL